MWNTLVGEYPPGCLNGAGKTLPNLKPDTRINKLKQELINKIKSLQNSEGGEISSSYWNIIFCFNTMSQDQAYLI